MLGLRRHIAAGRLATFLGVAAVTAVMAALPATAHAQALIERFEPAPRGSRFFVADSLELDGNLRFAAGVVTSYGHRLRTFRQAGTTDLERSDLLTHAVWIHPGASVVFAPGARFALDVPVALQSGNDVTLDRTFFARPGSPRLGDVRASFDLKLLGDARPDVDGAVLAAGIVGYLPTGSGSDYASDDFVRFGFRLASSFRIGKALVAARAGYTYRRHELEPVGGVALGSEANASLGIGYRFGPVFTGPELHGTTFLRSAFERRSTPIEALYGAHVALGDFRFGVGLGTALTYGLGAPRVRGVVSIEWAPSGSVRGDRDRDGVLDDDDLCPDVPGLAAGPVGSRGCPPAPRDADGDGIIDADDACPDLPGVRGRDAMSHGCPDADHDGIPDPLDACPKISGAPSVLPRFHGCPPDADGDGVADDRDACPDEPGPVSDDQEKSGCPLPPAPQPDGDGDGVTDAEDACPEVAGPKSTVPELDGCPIARPEGVTTLQLGFESAPALALRTDSARLVAKLAATLAAHPDVRVHVAIVASPKTRLDAKRAPQQQKVVIDRLVELGVARSRFDARRATTPAQKKAQLEVRVQPDGIR